MSNTASIIDFCVIFRLLFFSYYLCNGEWAVGLFWLMHSILRLLLYSTRSVAPSTLLSRRHRFWHASNLWRRRAAPNRYVSKRCVRGRGERKRDIPRGVELQPNTYSRSSVFLWSATLHMFFSTNLKWMANWHWRTEVQKYTNRTAPVPPLFANDAPNPRKLQSEDQLSSAEH